MKLEKQEWDFRQVRQDYSLFEASFYEYSRSDKAIREKLTRWLELKFKGKTVRDHIISALKKNQAVKGDAQFAYKEQTQKGFAEFARKKWPGLSHRHFYLVTAIQPNFPAPWLARFSIKANRNPNYSHLKIESLAWRKQNLKKWIAVGDPDEIEIALHGFEKSYELEIDWRADGHGFRVGDIVKDFERWITKEAKKHKQWSVNGHKAKPQTDPLKWLAAYRLSEAGYTHHESLNLLDGLLNDRYFLPLYSDKSGWSDAKRRAKQLIKLLHTHPESWPTVK